jgi:hypothetical protein
MNERERSNESQTLVVALIDHKVKLTKVHRRHDNGTLLGCGQTLLRDSQ